MDRFAPVRLPSIAGMAASTGYTMPTLDALLPARFRGTGFSGFGAADKYLADALGSFPAYDEVFGGGASVGAAFTNVNALAGGALAPAAPHINASAKRWGIPANLLAAVIARESTGNWARDGYRYTHLPERGHGILPYTGMTDPAIRRVGETVGRLTDGVNDMADQIDAAAELLRQIADNEAKGYGWRGVANVYYSGDPSGSYTPGDSWQYGSTQSYGNDILDFWNRLEPGGPDAAFATGAKTAARSAGGSLGNVASIWGGGSASLTQEFGLTDFAQKVLSGAQFPGMYDYSASLGVQGHAGLDYGMVTGTTLYAPVSGTVITAGGTGFYTDERYGKFAPGSGELRIKLDNGDELILGHMERITVAPGQRISAGTAVGYSGTYNGPHVHIEYRQSTPGRTSSGYTAVDPRQVLGNAGSSLAGSMTALDAGTAATRNGTLLGTSLASLFGW